MAYQEASNHFRLPTQHESTAIRVELKAYVPDNGNLSTFILRFGNSFTAELGPLDVDTLIEKLIQFRTDVEALENQHNRSTQTELEGPK